MPSIKPLYVLENNSEVSLTNLSKSKPCLNPRIYLNNLLLYAALSETIDTDAEIPENV